MLHNRYLFTFFCLISFGLFEARKKGWVTECADSAVGCMLRNSVRYCTRFRFIFNHLIQRPSYQFDFLFWLISSWITHLDTGKMPVKVNNPHFGEKLNSYFNVHYMNKKDHIMVFLGSCLQFWSSPWTHNCTLLEHIYEPGRINTAV